MKTNSLKSLISIGVLGVILLACNKPNKEETSILPANTDEEMSVSKTVYEPDADFEQARDAFMHKEYNASSEHILDAIKYMRELSIGVGEKEKQAIEKSILELKDLAKDVTTDRIDSEEELDYYFGKAFLALANSKVIMAENLVIKGDKEKAGSSMQEAMHHFENAGQRLEKDWVKEDDSIYTNMENLSVKLKKETESLQSEMEQDFQKLKKDLDDLNRNAQKEADSIS